MLIKEMDAWQALMNGVLSWNPYLAEHFDPRSCLGGLIGRAVDAHGLPVARELQCELFPPHVQDDLVAGGAHFTLVQRRLVGVVHIHFLHQHHQGGLCCLTHFLICALGLSKFRDLIYLNGLHNVFF